MNKHLLRSGEQGQAIVILVVAMIALLGFAGLAIDGGNLYAQRRHAQGAIDNAALAYGLSLSRNETTDEAVSRANSVLQDNGFVNGEDGVEVDMVQSGNDITISLTDDVPTAFIHFVYNGPAMYTVTATARGIPATYPFEGFGIVVVQQCSGTGASQVGLGTTGGGNSGGINVYNSGIVVNLPTPANSTCPFNPPNNGTGITASGGIFNVGSQTVFGGNMDTVTPNFNGGQPLVDPMTWLNEHPPECAVDGSFSDGKWQPGRYDNDNGTSAPEPGWGVYAPGIYCFNGDLDPNGNGTIVGTGVLFYFLSGGINLQGQGYIAISGPPANNCTPQPTSPYDPEYACSYPNLTIYAAPGNTSDFAIGGNGGSNIVGTIYVPSATFDASGGGSNPQETVVTGQIIAGSVHNNGNGSLRVVYDETKIYALPPSMQLLK